MANGFTRLAWREKRKLARSLAHLFFFFRGVRIVVSRVNFKIPGYPGSRCV